MFPTKKFFQKVRDVFPNFSVATPHLYDTRFLWVASKVLESFKNIPVVLD